MITDHYPKKISINGRFLTQPVTGVQRYAYELVRAWDVMLANDEIDPQHYQIELVTPNLDTPVIEFQCITIRQVGHLRGNLWEQIDLPWHTRGKFLFNPCNIGPMIKVNQAVTIHDASVFAVPQSYSVTFRMKNQVIQSLLSKTARAILSDSEFSKQELIRYCHIAPEKIKVISLGCDHVHRIIADPHVFQRYGIGEKPYVLAVGSNAPHKNFSIIGEAARLLPPGKLDIVIAGSDFGGWFNSVPESNSQDIKKLGYVTEGELKALYEGAIAFIFPSIYEGFGLPPLEAMACGCPVIVSKTASLPEICSDAALYIDPDRPEDLSNKITYLLTNSSYRTMLKEKGYQQSNKYLWDNAARETWNNMRDIWGR